VTGTNAVQIFWTPPADDGGAPITGYFVRWPGSTVDVVPSPFPNNTFIVNRLENGVTVSVSVSAFNAIGEGPATVLPDFTPSWTGTMREDQSATTLRSGEILVSGGVSEWGITTGAMTYDPGTAAWTPVTTGERLRFASSAALLADGRVLVAGGLEYGNNTVVASTTAQIYDPVSKSFSDTGALVAGSSRAKATLLGDGTVLLAGGNDASFREFGGQGVLPQVYDPGTGTFTGVLGHVPRPGVAVATLPDGKALLVGQMDLRADAAAAALFDPATLRFTDVGPTAYRESATITVLKDGRALIAAGGTSSAEIYDPSARTFTRAADLLVPRKGHTATLLADGRVLFLGGTADGSNSVEIYDPATGGKAAPDLVYARSGHTASLLATGQLFILGGQHAPGPGNCPDELYEPP
jgi:hypothetical protein